MTCTTDGRTIKRMIKTQIQCEDSRIVGAEDATQMKKIRGSLRSLLTQY